MLFMIVIQIDDAVYGGIVAVLLIFCATTERINKYKDII